MAIPNFGDYVPLPSGDAPEALADWLEVALVCDDSREVSRDEVRDTFANRLFPEGDTDKLDARIDAVFREVQRRRLLCGANYPFERDPTSDVIRVDSSRAGLAYLFFLVLSFCETQSLRYDKNLVSPTFESIVANAVRAIFGNGTDSMRFGAPASPEHPKTVGPRMEKFGRLSNMRWLEAPGFKRSRTGDAGVDVACWMQFPDGFSALPRVFVQCATGKKWIEKKEQWSSADWRTWLVLGAEPIRAIAVPFVATKEQWEDSARSSVLLERFRLTWLLSLLDAADSALAHSFSTEVLRQYSNGSSLSAVDELQLASTEEAA